MYIIAFKHEQFHFLNKDVKDYYEPLFEVFPDNPKGIELICAMQAKVLNDSLIDSIKERAGKFVAVGIDEKLNYHELE